MANPVQSSGKQKTITAGTTHTYTAGANFTVGNWVFVTCTLSDANFTGMTIAGRTWIGGQVEQWPWAGTYVAIVAKEVLSSGQNTVNFNWSSGSANAVTFSVEEWSGITAFDLHPTDGTTSVSSGTLAQADEVVYALGCINGGGASTGPSSGYTQTWNDDGTGGYKDGTAGYKVVTTTASETATFGSTDWCGMATFRYTPPANTVAPKARHYSSMRAQT